MTKENWGNNGGLKMLRAKDVYRDSNKRIKGGGVRFGLRELAL